MNLMERGSQTAKEGFRNEDDIVEIFNNWKKDKDSQAWLILMKYKLTKIEGNLVPINTLKSTTNNIPDITDIVYDQSNNSTITIDNLIGLTNTFLYQNTPNPFSERTEIEYFINEGVKTSMLMIFDMQGVLKKQISIYSNGLGSTTIQASEFPAGMYLYTLVCDGQEIDTKRMILTE